jgi:segregation and condensation protein A
MVMDSSTISGTNSHYLVATPVYEGPLDLLLSLIQNADLDITALSLAQVTDQYLEYIHNLSNISAENVSAFLVIASKLLQIKSEALLPKSDDRDTDDEDPAEELAQQLKLYKRYKEIASYLENREISGLKSFYRLYPSPTVSARVDFSEYTIADILDAAHSILNHQEEKEPLDSVVRAPIVTIRSKISRIVSALRMSKHAGFKELLGENRSRLDIVVTFLALLELVKQHFIHAQQENTFGDIEIVKTEEWDAQAEFELEFGE